MLITLLGLLDVSAGIVLLLLRFGYGEIIGAALAVCLLCKSVYFMSDIASIVDIAAAIFLGLAALGFYHAIAYIFVLWLLQKGISSLLH